MISLAANVQGAEVGSFTDIKNIQMHVLIVICLILSNSANWVKLKIQ
jgi:hypothetical protein